MFSPWSKAIQPRHYLSMRAITKSFAGVVALRGVDLDVLPGEVHCILGQNGAGKSTLIKILSGAYQPDGGEIIWQGQPATIPSPIAALGMGIATMYQELDVVDGLTITENIYLGHELSTAGVLHTGAANRPTRDLLTRLGHGDLSPTREVGSLSAANKQIVSMARALSRDTHLIIMDEPSAVLDAQEVKNLFRVVEELTWQGIAVIYISHRLDEIRQIGDRITVIKDGQSMATGLPVADTPTKELIRLMTGRTVEHVFPPRRGCPADAPVVLEVDGLALRGTFSDVSFDVRAGEVVGLAGLVGSGRSEIVETVYGARKATGGTVSIDGTDAAAGLRRATPSTAESASPPKSARARACCSRSPIFKNVTLSTLRALRAGDAARRAPRAQARPRADRGARTASGRPRPAPPAPSPAATSRRSSSPAGSCTAPRCCCSTSRRAASTSAPAPRSTT